MGLLNHLLAGLVHLAIVATDVCLVLYSVHALAARWPTVPLLQVMDRHASPILQELWRLVNRFQGPRMLPLAWESTAGVLFVLGLLLLRLVLTEVLRLAA